MNPTESQVGLLRERDPAAFQQFYRDYWNLIFSICLRRLGDERLSEDAAQEVFLRAWAYIKNFRGESLPSTWLVAIAFNVCRGARAKLGREAVLQTSLNREYTPEPVTTPEELLSRAQRVQLAKELVKLKPTARLYYLQGLTYKEISAHLRVPIGTVKSRIARECRELRQLVKKRESGRLQEFAGCG